MVVPFVRRDPVPPVSVYTIPVGETHRSYTEVRFSCKAGRTRLGRLHEFKRFRMTTKEYLDRRWRWLGRIARGNGSQELQKLLTCSGWESIGRMADDIRMHMFSEMEPDGDSARICVGITIRNQRKAGG